MILLSDKLKSLRIRDPEFDNWVRWDLSCKAHRFRGPRYAVGPSLLIITTVHRVPVYPCPLSLPLPVHPGPPFFVPVIPWSATCCSPLLKLLSPLSIQISWEKQEALLDACVGGPVWPHLSLFRCKEEFPKQSFPPPSDALTFPEGRLSAQG